MTQWRMRTVMVVSLLVVSLGLTALCLLVVRVNVARQIRQGLASDLQNSMNTYGNLARQRHEMLTREAALVADLPSLKALMSTHDIPTIRDGSDEFWQVSGSDFFALTDAEGRLLTYSNRQGTLREKDVRDGILECVQRSGSVELLASGLNLLEVSARPLYFGSSSTGTLLGYVVLGYSIDSKVAKQVSEAAAAQVAFFIGDEAVTTTLSADRLRELREHMTNPRNQRAGRETFSLGGEQYMAASAELVSTSEPNVSLVVLKSYDQASGYLHELNRSLTVLGLAALLIGGLLATAIARTVTRPLEALVAGTRALARGNFGLPLQTSGVAEVRELGTAFEGMRLELKNKQDELLKAERLATIGRMASSVSHDLRHHLSAIYANAEFLSLAATQDNERAELLVEVRDAVQEMTELIESLLLFSQTGRALNPSLESTTMLVERTVQSVRRHPEARGVEITLTSTSSAEAWIDGRKLGRAIFNLVLNACQAARKSPQPQVSVTTIELANMVEIAIEDSGQGVPMEIAETLFQPFVSAGKENGVGLGLTLAQHIAQEHGGEVRLELSKLNRTVFRLEIQKHAPSGPHQRVVEPTPGSLFTPEEASLVELPGTAIPSGEK